MLIPKGALVISCQARADNPLHGPVYMSAMAQAAEAGGARGIRANGEADVAAIRAVTKLPIIGIAKVWDDRFPVYITPGFEQAAQVARAGADIVGIDATLRPRNGEPVGRLIGRIRTEETAFHKTGGPDLELLSALVAEVPVPIVAEGRFDTPELVAEAFRRGAHAVVVGTAVTNPREITKKFVQAIS